MVPSVSFSNLYVLLLITNKILFEISLKTAVSIYAAYFCAFSNINSNSSHSAITDPVYLLKLITK